MNSRSALRDLISWVILVSSSFYFTGATRPSPIGHRPGFRTSGRSNPARIPAAGGCHIPVRDASLPLRPERFQLGEFVGARVKTYEKGSKVDSIHPGVVVGGPDSDRNYLVAMISKKLPGGPPQKPISTYQHGTNLEGSISHIPTLVPWSGMKYWKQKNTGTGGRQPKLLKEKLDELLGDIRTAQEALQSSIASESYLDNP